MSKQSLEFDKRRQAASPEIYFSQAYNILGDIVINVMPEKVFIERLFSERWSSLRSSELESLSLAERLLISLIINDLVLRPDVLAQVVHEILGGAAKKLSTGSFVSISLESESVIHIMLSEATCRLLKRHHDDLAALKIDVQKTLSRLNQWFWREESPESFMGGFALFIKPFLPPLIFASIAGFIDFACLDKRVLDRAKRIAGTPNDEPHEISDLQIPNLPNPVQTLLLCTRLSLFSQGPFSPVNFILKTCCGHSFTICMCKMCKTVNPPLPESVAMRKVRVLA